MNIYITGTSGFLGKELVKNSSHSNLIKKIYCPIRDKYKLKAEQRFDNLFSSYDKCSFCKCGLIPKDTNIVVLNAFSVSFLNEIKKVFDENVTPIFNLLNICKNLPNLKKIIFISTAYTQPPSCNINNSLWTEVIETKNVIEHYNNIIKSKIKWHEIKNKKINPHFSQNTYIYSKIITEQICKYFSDKINCPLSIIRPSQIAISTDGKYASKFGSMSYAFSLYTPVIRVLINKGKRQDQIPVDIVSSIIISEYTNMSNNIILATSGSKISLKQVKQIIMPSKFMCFFDEKNVMFYFLRNLELLFYKILNIFGLLSNKKYKIICLFYQNYDYFHYNTWFFPSNYPISDINYYILSIKKYVENKKDN